MTPAFAVFVDNSGGTRMEVIPANYNGLTVRFARVVGRCVSKAAFDAADALYDLSSYNYDEFEWVDVLPDGRWVFGQVDDFQVQPRWRVWKIAETYTLIGNDADAIVAREHALARAVTALLEPGTPYVKLGETTTALQGAHLYRRDTWGLGRPRAANPC